MGLSERRTSLDRNHLEKEDAFFTRRIFPPATALGRRFFWKNASLSFSWGAAGSQNAVEDVGIAAWKAAPRASRRLCYLEIWPASIRFNPIAIPPKPA